MKTNRYLVRVILLFLLVSASVVSASPVRAKAAAPIVSATKAATKLTSVYYELEVSPGDKAKDTVFVTPAYGRTLKVQFFNASAKKWQTIRTYTMGNEKKTYCRITYPADYWKNMSSSKWRIYLPSTDTASAYISNTITIKNLAPAAPELHCKSAVIMNASTGQVLYKKSMNKQLPQASLTKLMTTVLAIENNSLKDKVKISKAAATTPWTYIPLKENDRAYLQDLLYSSLLASSNGSAVALAEHTAGSVSRFADMMNEKAADLGCKNTHYKNPHGLDEKKHYSSAYDTALLTAYAWQNSAFRKIIRTESYSFSTITQHRLCSFSTSNALLGNISGMQGGKTGTTSGAGNCFSGIYTCHDVDYIIVVMGSDTVDTRWEDARELIRYAKACTP